MHIHIVGIAGTMTAPLAVALKNQGHHITGSDQQQIFPPVSHILKKAQIKINTQNIINSQIDLCIIGSSYLSFANTRQEFDTIKKLKLPYISATEYIAQNVCKNNSILVAGTYGKTTITSLISWILIRAQYQPSFMFGGEPKNNIPSLQIQNSDWSITEADESINGLDLQGKFLYYPLKYLLLTSADWEHKESYLKESDNFSAFSRLIKKVPKAGFLVLNSQGTNILKLSKLTPAKAIFYNSNSSSYFIKNTTKSNHRTLITIATPKGDLTVISRLWGQFNYENILAAVTLTSELGIDPLIIKKAIASYKGIKRRLELLNFSNNIHFFDDFAQSASRIQSVIDSLKQEFPQSNIKVFYEPHASYMKNKNSLPQLKPAFKNASEIIIGKINYTSTSDKINRVTATDLKKSIGNNSTYLPLYDQVFRHYTQNLKPNDILIHMSSGGILGLNTYKKIINYFNNVKIHR